MKKDFNEMGEQTEHEIQVGILQFCHRHDDDRLKSIFAIPNGGHRSIGEASRLKAEGVKAGVSDLFLPIPSESSSGLFLEVKRPNGRLSREQRVWIDTMALRGYNAAVGYGLDDCIEIIESHLAGAAIVKH